MDSFKDYINNKEEEQLDEDIAGAIGTVLGLTTAGIILAWGGSLLVYAGTTAASKIVGVWRKIKEKIDVIRGIKKEDVKEAVDLMKQDAKVRLEKEKNERHRREFEEELTDVYSAIEKKDFVNAREAFNRLPKTLKDNPDVAKVVIAEVTKEMGEPPLYVVSPGNKTYQAIKRIINIRTARAAADATRMALDKQLNKVKPEEEADEFEAD
jgi:hypothetical protein